MTLDTDISMPVTSTAQRHQTYDDDDEFSLTSRLSTRLSLNKHRLICPCLFLLLPAGCCITLRADLTSPAPLSLSLSQGRLSDQLAQRTVLYSALERRWRDGERAHGSLRSEIETQVGR
jgi:hypothetical protein